MRALIFLALLLVQGEGPLRNVPQSGGFHFSGRILREGFTRDQTPPRMTIRLTDVGQRGRSGSPPTFLGDVAADGSFEFSGLPSGHYSLFLFPDVQPEALALPIVNIDEDIGDFWWTVPLTAMTVTLTATVTLDGVVTLPAFQLALKDTNQSSSREEMKSGPVGNAITMPGVPYGEYAVRILGLPEGYSIKSFTEGRKDLQSQKLLVHPASPPHVEITLTRG